MGEAHIPFATKYLIIINTLTAWKVQNTTGYLQLMDPAIFIKYLHNVCYFIHSVLIPIECGFFFFCTRLKIFLIETTYITNMAQVSLID